jgi:hypothetical protein
MLLLCKTIFWGLSGAISADFMSKILGFNNSCKYRNIGFVMGCIRGYTGKTLFELLLN